MGAKVVPNDIAAPTGQPTSNIERFKSNRSTIASVAGLKEDVNKPITKLIPTNPIPIVMPARKDLLKPCFRSRPKIIMIIGNITDGPKSKIKSIAD